METGEAAVTWEDVQHRDDGVAAAKQMNQASSGNRVRSKLCGPFNVWELCGTNAIVDLLCFREIFFG
jgi:hypothetical protein